MSDLESRAFTRQGNHLVPSDIMAEEYLASVPEGKEVLLTWRRPRMIANHRHYFAILRAAAEQLEAYPGEDELLDAIKIAVGWVRPVQKTNGDIIWLPKSINFAQMDEFAFKRFKDRSLYVLGQLLGCDPQELLDEASKSRQGNR